MSKDNKKETKTYNPKGSRWTEAPVARVIGKQKVSKEDQEASRKYAEALLKKS